jgi:hypothetical protein
MKDWDEQEESIELSFDLEIATALMRGLRTKKQQTTRLFPSFRPSHCKRAWIAKRNIVREAQIYVRLPIYSKIF